MKDIANKTTEELTKTLDEEREKVRSLGFSQGLTRVKNVKEGRTSKKLIAQVLTELRKRA